jgi:hypothetical protein
VRCFFPTIAVCLACLAGWASAAAQAQDTLALENGRLGLSFDQRTGTLTAIHNKLAGETYAVSGDEFAVEAVEFGIEFGKPKLAAVKQSGGTLDARYEADGMTVEVTYALRGENHFAEKQITLTATRNYGLKKLVLSAKKGSGAFCAQHPSGRSGKMLLTPFSAPSARRGPAWRCAFLR